MSAILRSDNKTLFCFLFFSIMLYPCFSLVYNWEFNIPPGTDLIFSGNATDVNITIEDLRQYIYLPSISTPSLTRPTAGLLVMNHQHKISITQVSFSNDAYSVCIVIFITIILMMN